MTLIDRFGRPLKSLRVSVTSRCNFRCIYCHNEGFPKDSAEVLKPSDYEVIAMACKDVGIERVKLTGGEPLMREDIVDIVGAFSRHVKEVSMTTNGFYLRDLASKLAAAGLKRVCISVPSIRKSVFERITRVDALDRVLDGIREAYDAGLRPITLNTVVLKWFTIDELESLIELVSRYEARLRLIELEPLGLGMEIFSKYHRPLDDIVAYLDKRASRKYVRELHSRPVYVLDNGIEVEIVAWFGNPRFCRSCDRVRLSSNGKLLPCIAKTIYVDLAQCFRADANEAKSCVIAKLIEVNELREPFYKY